METLFFDLFWTLIAPAYSKEDAENELLGLSVQAWTAYQEDPRVADERYRGHVASEREMMEKIIALLPEPVSDELFEKVCAVRLERIRKGIVNVQDEILATLKALRAAGHQICIVSNADLMDVHYWSECALKDAVDGAVFSCDEGTIKPEKRIYEIAMERMGAKAENSVFIGDGGSDELYGARVAGMKTVLTEHFSVKEPGRREKITADADILITRFGDLPEAIEKLRKKQ